MTAAREMEPVRPEDLAYGEVDGAASINAVAVAERLNALLEIVKRIEARAGQNCRCMNCIVIGGCR